MSDPFKKMIDSEKRKELLSKIGRGFLSTTSSAFQKTYNVFAPPKTNAQLEREARIRAIREKAIEAEITKQEIMRARAKVAARYNMPYVEKVVSGKGKSKKVSIKTFGGTTASIPKVDSYKKSQEDFRRLFNM